MQAGGPCDNGSFSICDLWTGSSGPRVVALCNSMDQTTG
jgi:hypothetical protein